MKLNSNQIQHLSELILSQWKKQNLVTFKSTEAQVLAKIVAVITADYQRETDLEKEVNQMLDNLERTNSGEFQRYKMFPILKQKLAKDKKVIL